MALENVDIKDPRVQKIFITLAVLLLITVFWYTQSYQPNSKQIRFKKENLESLNLQLSTAKLAAGKLPELKKEMEESFIKYKLLEQLLPTDRDVPDFITRINVAARENNISIKNIELQPSETRPYFIANPHRIEVTANYHDLASFIEALANMPFIATEKNFHIRRNTRGKGSISAIFNVISYHIPSKDRIEKPDQLAGTQAGASSGAQQTEAPLPGQPPEGVPRATRDDAVTGLSGGVGPPPE